jgi:hypothetical protein
MSKSFTTVRVPKEVLEDMAEECQRFGVTISAMVTKAIEQFSVGDYMESVVRNVSKAGKYAKKNGWSEQA